jgi:hypothetical protein
MKKINSYTKYEYYITKIITHTQTNMHEICHSDKFFG